MHKGQRRPPARKGGLLNTLQWRASTMTRYTYGQPGQVRQLANPYAHRGRAARLGGLDEQCTRPQPHYVVALLGALFGPNAAHAARLVGQHFGQRLGYYPC